MIFTITGPSGSGKDSLVDAILYLMGEKPESELSSFVLENINSLKKICIPNYMKNNNYLRELISHTTRTPRIGEVNGKDYHFITKAEFDQLKKVESTCYAGNYYCLSQKAIDNLSAKNGIVIVDIDGRKAIENYVGKDGMKSFFISVFPDEIESRMITRGDSAENIQKRLRNAYNNKEFDNGPNCDYVIRNDNFIDAVSEIINKM